MHAHVCKHENTCAHAHTCTGRVSRAPGPPQRDVQDEDRAVHYVLLSAPWAVLCYYAEDLRLKLPLQVPGSWGTGRPGPYSSLHPMCWVQLLVLTALGPPSWCPRGPLPPTITPSHEKHYWDTGWGDGTAPPWLRGGKVGDSMCSRHGSELATWGPALRGWGGSSRLGDTRRRGQQVTLG